MMEGMSGMMMFGMGLGVAACRRRARPWGGGARQVPVLRRRQMRRTSVRFSMLGIAAAGLGLALASNRQGIKFTPPWAQRA